MKKQQQLYLLFFILSFLILISACSNPNKKSAKLIKPDSIERANPIPLPPTKLASPYLSIQTLQNFVHNASLISSNKNAGKPFALLDYNKVIAYDFDGNEEAFQSIIRNDGGRLVWVIKKQQELSQHQVNDVTNLLSQNSTYGSNTAACFNPRLGLVFYKNDSVVMHISICLECNYLESSLEIPASQHKKEVLDNGVTIARIGFTKAGRKKLKEFCDELDFYYKREASTNDE